MRNKSNIHHPAYRSEVKIITLDGKQHAFLPFEEFVAAASGGTRNYNKIIYR